MMSKLWFSVLLMEANCQSWGRISPICLIKDHILHLHELEVHLDQDVEKTTRGGNQDVRVLMEGSKLVIHPVTSKDNLWPQVHVASKLKEWNDGWKSSHQLIWFDSDFWLIFYFIYFLFFYFLFDLFLPTAIHTSIHFIRWIYIYKKRNHWLIKGARPC